MRSLRGMVGAAVAPGSRRPDEQLSIELARLQAALGGAAREIAAAAGAADLGDDPAFRLEFLDAAAELTRAVAREVAEPPVGASELPKAAGALVRLAAERAAPIDEISRRFLAWREASLAEISGHAARGAVGRAAAARAGSAVERTFALTLVRICEAVEEQRLRTDRHLRFLATHDPLTGLANRALVCERLARLRRKPTASQADILVAFVDIDDFKVVNDTLGHAAGDELLRLVAERLSGVVRERDAVGRLGGDEFVVILEQAAGAIAPDAVARRLLDAFTEPFLLARGSARLRVRASVGIASSAVHSPDRLMRDADVAMYRAKASGGDRYELTRPRRRA